MPFQESVLIMELLTSTDSISGKIESIIKEAEDDLYIISPYIQLEKSENNQWDNIIKVLKFAYKEGATIYIVSRQSDEEVKDILLFDKLKESYNESVKILLVPNLHAKLYYNGESALITSMNMYFHSSLNNYEIGVQLSRKRTPDDMKKLKKYISYLIDEAIEYKSKKERVLEKKLHDKQEKLEDHELIQFEVVSKGYKWIKVRTSDGYENKILIKDVPDLEEQKHYSVKAKRKWLTNYYGYTVQLEKVHDIEEIQSFCISCRKPTDGKYELCYSCNSKFKNDKSQVKFIYCKSCGKKKSNISQQRPECRVCYKSSKYTEKSKFKSEKALISTDFGFCIICGLEIPYDSSLKIIRCRDCWTKDRKGLKEGKFCFNCGKTFSSSVDKPICGSCSK